MAKENWKDKLADLSQSMMYEAAEAEQQGLMSGMTNTTEQPEVRALQNGSYFSGYLLVRSAEVRTGKTGQPYLDMKLCDKTGEAVCKLWNCPRNMVAPHSGAVVQLSGTVEEYNKQLQMRVQDFGELKDVSAIDMTTLVPSAPEKPEVMLQKLQDTIDSFRSEELRALVQEMLRMAGDKLMYFPAAQRMHHAEYGGLLHHTTGMLNTAEHIIQAYPFLHGDLLRAGVIIHDLAKLEEMDSDKLGNVNDYTMDGLLVGHIVRGVVNLDRAARRVGVSGELVELLEHMLLSHHGIPEYGSPRMPMFPEAEVLHWIDTLDARMNELQGIEDRTQPGAFSERINSLDGRRIYHPRYRMSRVEPEEEA